MLRTLCLALVAAVVFAMPAEAKKKSSKSQSNSLGKTVVDFNLNYPEGAIVVVNSERRLYYVLGNGKAIRYPVAVGKSNEIWTGMEVVTEKRKNPAWRHPDGGNTVPGGPNNPLGVRAMYLGWSLWRIHGTPKRGSIGSATSNGCIRMYNEHVTDLYERVHVGAPVYVINTRNDATLNVGYGGRKAYASR